MDYGPEYRSTLKPRIQRPQVAGHGIEVAGKADGDNAVVSNNGLQECSGFAGWVMT
ncbi:hypothetical protein [Gilvimarinus chinensis]|uniref:hypothetical protein n=1 Tax=Gilvimarinus chinensis TaxID=396005 RepID=UPI0003A958DA|nr:hypothetical protein [Gilvimarinus chinensis]